MSIGPAGGVSTGSLVSVVTWKMIGEGPWKCNCGKVLISKGRGSNDAVIHHIDENRSNNRRENLVVMCGACHRSLHHKGVRKSDEMKRKNSIYNTGVKRSPETCEKIRQAKLAWWAARRMQSSES